MTVDPDEPECDSEYRVHVWEDTCNVRSHGGGVITKEVCSDCGLIRITDTWAQNPDNDMQGLTSISYEYPEPE